MRYRAVAAATLLTLVMAAPVLVAPNERAFGSESVGRHHDPFTVMRQFAGAPVPGVYLQPATDWPGRTLAHVLSPVAAYNVIVLATFPLAAFFGYLLAFEITRSRFSSMVAGLAFAFSPFHVAHAAYHPHIAQVQWIALFMLAVWRCVHGLTTARAVVLAVASALVSASNFYGALIAATLAPAVVLLFWLTPDGTGRRRERRDLAGTVAVLVGLGLVALGLLYVFAPGVLGGEGVPRVPREDLFRYSARWWAHFVPSVDHAFLGTWAQTRWEAYGIGPGLLEQQLYLGCGLVALAAAAAWRWTRDDDATLRGVPALMAVAAVAMLLALSPSREIGGWHVMRPSAVLYELAPMFRSYARFSVVVQLMVAILAGIGARSLWQSRSRAAQAAVAGLLALTVFEYAPLPWRWRDVLPTSAHRWLARQGGTPRVFDCTAPALAEGPTAFLAGFQIQYPSAAHPTCGEPSLGLELRAERITHVILRAGDPAWPVLDARTPVGLREAYRAPDSAVFEVTGGALVPFMKAGRGWLPREYRGTRTWRWSSGESSLQLWNPGPGPCTVTLSVELESFAVPRHVSFSIDGAPLGKRLVGLSRARQRFGPVVVPAGLSEMALKSREAAMAPNSVEPSLSDTRHLAIAVGDWKMEAGSCASNGTPTLHPAR